MIFISITEPFFSGSNVLRFLRKLDDLKIGVLTYGLAFHIHRTKILRFPYHKEEFFEQVNNFRYF